MSTVIVAISVVGDAGGAEPRQERLGEVRVAVAAVVAELGVVADVLRQHHPLDVAAREQLADRLDDPALALALERREAHPEEVELDRRAALDDRQVILVRGVRVGVADDDPGQVDALGLEHVELVEPDRRTGPRGS